MNKSKEILFYYNFIEKLSKRTKTRNRIKGIAKIAAGVGGIAAATYGLKKLAQRAGERNLQKKYDTFTHQLKTGERKIRKGHPPPPFNIS